jgi:YggT family protein
MDLLLKGIAEVLNMALTLYMWVVIISALMSWVNPDPYNPIVRFLRGLTEPVFYRVRRWLPFIVIGGIDLTPVVIIFAIVFLKTFLVGNLIRLSMHV